MKKVLEKRFSLIYFLGLLISGVCAYFLNGVLNPELNGYSDFIADVLNFSSILTGFLGAVLGILASISKSSSIMMSILNIKNAKKQFLYALLIPFIMGIINILSSMIFRLWLQNNIDEVMILHLNIIFLTTSIFFVYTGVAMTLFIFTIFFKDDIDEKPKRHKPNLNHEEADF